MVYPPDRGNGSPTKIPTATWSGPMNALSFSGCYATAIPLNDYGPYTFQTSGNCQPICYQLDKPVMALSDGTHCWCGDLLPPLDSKVDNDKCDTPCAGYDKEMCGGNSFWSVYLTGITKNKIPNYNPDNPVNPSAASSPSSSSKTTSTSPISAVVTVRGSTIIISVAQTVTSTLDAPVSVLSIPEYSESAKPSKAGIAAGVVVGLVVLAALVVGIFLWIRVHKRRSSLAASSPADPTAKSVTSKTAQPSLSSIGDSRLDPDAVLQRRFSDGSMADNHDYSRRILRVANPDDR